MNMSANHIELRNDTQRYENQLYRTTPKEYKVDDVKTTPKRARTSVQISTVRSSRPLQLSPSCLGSFDTILTMVKYDVTRVNEEMTLTLTVGIASPPSKIIATQNARDPIFGDKINAIRMHCSDQNMKEILVRSSNIPRGGRVLTGLIN